MAALEQQRVDLSQRCSLLGRHVDTRADELDSESMVLVRFRAQILARARVGALSSNQDAADRAVSINECGLDAAILLNIDAVELLPPVHLAAYSRVLEQCLPEPQPADTSPVIGRDAELGLKGFQVQEEKIARVILSDLGVDLGGIHALQGLGVQELSQKRQRPVQRNRPALVSRCGRLVTFVDFKRDIGLGERASLAHCLASQFARSSH